MRQIPMTSKAVQEFENVLKNRVSAEPVTIEKYSGFLFLDKYGLPKVSINYEHVFHGIVKKYNI